MRIEYEGEPYEFEMADMTVKQAIKIEKYLGCPIAQFGERLDTSDGKSPDLLAMQCLGWLILHGGQGAIDDTDFKMAALTQAVAAALPADPTPADPSADGAATTDVPLTVP